jgi:hypothetical protein
MIALNQAHRPLFHLELSIFPRDRKFNFTGVDDSNNLTQEGFNFLNSRKLSTGNLGLYIHELELLQMYMMLQV